MDCKEAQNALLESFVAPIPAGDRLAVENHLAGCEACRRFAEIQARLDARLSAALPPLSPGPLFRDSLREKLTPHPSDWPEYLPDLAHLTGSAAAIALMLVFLPHHPRAVLLAGSGLAAVTYFLQAVLRESLERLDDV